MIYKYRWIDKIIIPPASAITLGKSIHSALEVNYSQKIRTKQDLPIQQLSTQRTQEDINRFLKILAYVSKAITSGIFYPNENYFCGICGYKDLCKKW